MSGRGAKSGHGPISGHGFGLLAGAACLGGCAISPVQPIVGSYFPSWLLCAIAGVIGTAVIRQLLVMAKLETHLLSPPLTYLAIAVGLTLVLWLLLFGL